MRLLKCILLIIFLMLVGTWIRNAVIIKSLINKNVESQKVDNYHSVTTFYQGDDMFRIETYYKEGRYISTTKLLQAPNFSRYIYVNDGKVLRAYVEHFDGTMEEFEIEQDAYVLNFNFSNSLESYDFWTYLRNVFFVSARSAKCNGRDCYYFTNLVTINMTISEGGYTGVYIDKETGLTVRSGGSGSSNGMAFDGVNDWRYEFGVVTDEDVAWPLVEKE